MDTNPDLSQIASGLVLQAPDLWVAKHANETLVVSGSPSLPYPEIGNASCFEIEADSFWFSHRNACILTAVQQFPFAGYLFDIGGGNGFVAQHLSRNQIPTIVVEPGVVGVQNAVSRGCIVVHATLEDAGFHQASLPAVGLFDVVEHIQQPRQFLRLVTDMLTPGGYLFLTVPAYHFLWSHEDDFAGHHWRYTRGQIQSLVEGGDSSNDGLEILFSTYFFALLPLPIFLLRTIPGRILKMEMKSEYATETEGSPRRSGSSHRPGLRFVESLFKWERTWIQKRLRIPFGASCLVVARKRP